ncbi:COG1361 S-layer family protein [Geoglobus sp.]
MKAIPAVLLLLSLVIVQTASASADFTFHVSLQDSTLHPGEEAVLTILIENDARLSGFAVNENTSSLIPLLTTAKNLRVEVDDSELPFSVRSANPYIVGDLPSGIVARAVFTIQVDDDAGEGKYTLPVKLRFSRVTYYLENGNPVISYENEVDVEYVGVTVEKKDYDFSLAVLEGQLISGEEGAIRVEIVNSGKNPVENCVVILNATPPFRPNPSGAAAYIGHLSPMERKNATFKLYVMDGAVNQTYPATFLIRFETTSGVPRAVLKTVGLNVYDRTHFSLVKSASFIPGYTPVPGKAGIPGVRGYVVVSLKNSGESVSDAVAFLKFENRMLRAENSPYLGNFSSGDVRNLVFYITSTAPPGKYRGILEIAYRNELGDDEVSGRIPVEVEVGGQNSIAVELLPLEDIGAGTVESIRVRVKNTLDEDITDLRLTLVSPEPTIAPVSSTAYIHSLRAGESREVAFRISVSDQVAEGEHSLYLLERYSVDGVHDLVSVSEIPVVIRPLEKDITVVSVRGDLTPDETGSLELTVLNAGNRTMYDAILELDLSPPLHPAGSSSLMGITGKPQPSYYYIGTLAPGQQAVAKFRVEVDKDAGMGDYPISVRVRYDDEEGYTHLTFPVTASVRVVEKPVLTPVVLVASAMVAAAVTLSAVFFRKRRRIRGRQ